MRYYNNLHMSDSWNIPCIQCTTVFRIPAGQQREITCWNCGKAGCNPDHCPEPCTRSKIDENHCKWSENTGKTKAGKGLHGNAVERNGNYKQEKWVLQSLGILAFNQSMVKPMPIAGRNTTGKFVDGIPPIPLVFKPVGQLIQTLAWRKNTAQPMISNCQKLNAKFDLSGGSWS